MYRKKIYCKESNNDEWREFRVGTDKINKFSDVMIKEVMSYEQFIASFPDKDNKIKNATMCPECLSEDIGYGRFYRICNNCRTSLDTSKIVWG